MRKIKFKIWCKGTSDNANFNKPGWWEIHSYLINRYYPIEDVLSIPEHSFYQHFELCQFTGLLDKNGVEIYEGDIIKSKFRNFLCEVKYGEYHYHDDDENLTTVGFYLVYKYGTCPLGKSIEGNTECYEVIGNIYENKELLDD